jgi:hypothetical protein
LVEYLYDAIRVSGGHDATITAKIYNDAGDAVIEGCMLMIHSAGEHLFDIMGEYAEDTWFFTIPAEKTKELNGRYWYCICSADTDLCFKQPIYFLR